MLFATTQHQTRLMLPPLTTGAGAEVGGNPVQVKTRRFWQAAAYGQEEAARQLISRGADVNFQNNYGKYHILIYILYVRLS